MDEFWAAVIGSGFGIAGLKLVEKIAEKYISRSDIVQADSIQQRDELRRKVEELTEQLISLRDNQILTLQQEVVQLKEENKELRGRIIELERENSRLENERRRGMSNE
jgi:predicted nuclease with TOPRIM domain